MVNDKSITAIIYLLKKDHKISVTMMTLEMMIIVPSQCLKVKQVQDSFECNSPKSLNLQEKINLKI